MFSASPTIHSPKVVGIAKYFGVTELVKSKMKDFLKFCSSSDFPSCFWRGCPTKAKHQLQEMASPQKKPAPHLLTQIRWKNKANKKEFSFTSNSFPGSASRKNLSVFRKYCWENKYTENCFLLRANSSSKLVLLIKAIFNLNVSLNDFQNINKTILNIQNYLAGNYYVTSNAVRKSFWQSQRHLQFLCCKKT